MTGERDLRSIGPDDTISAAVLRDFLLSTLRHDAIHDVLVERLAFHAERQQLDTVGLAAVLPELIGDVLHVVTKEDWTTVAELLIEGAREALGEGEGR